MVNLINFHADASALRVMLHYNNTGHDAGDALRCFGSDDLASIQVGDAQGEDHSRGAYDWWPLTLDGNLIGELRDDATGMTIHVTPDTFMHGIGILTPATDLEG
jgi:hypothetical protein